MSPRFLQKDYRSRIDELLEDAKPEREPGQKPRGKLGAEGHRFFDAVEKVVEMTAAEITGEQAKLKAMLTPQEAKPGEKTPEPLTDEQAADIFERQQILDTYGNLKDKSAAELAGAFRTLREIYQTNRNRWKAVELARLADVRRMADGVSDTLGGPSYAGTQRQKKAATKLKTFLSGANLDFKSFAETLDALLGEAHPLAKRWTQKVRRGFYEATDSAIALRKEWKAAIESATGLKGMAARLAVWRMADEQSVTVTTAGPDRSTLEPVSREIVERLAAGTVTPRAMNLTEAEAAELTQALAEDSARVEKLQNKGERAYPVKTFGVKRPARGESETISYTEAEAVCLTMLWRQEQYKPVLDAAGFDAGAVEQAEEQLSDAAKALREYMAAKYAGGYEPLARVFRRMFGVDLPQIANYAPAQFYHMGADHAAGPEDGSTAPGGFRAGMLASRKKHRAAPRIENAFAMFFGHRAQTAHWKAMAETVREMRGVFGNPDVKRAIEAAHGPAMGKTLSDWLKAIEGNGLQQNQGETDKLLRWVMRQQMYIALAWKTTTLAVQSTAALGSAYKMPGRAYVRGMKKLLSLQMNGTVLEMWESDTIQRRILAGSSPEVRAALTGLWEAKPGHVQDFLDKGMELIGFTDALFTTASAAVAYDHYRSEAIAAGVSPEMAKAQALSEVEDIVARTAQPAENDARSLFELRQNTWGKLAFLYASEARQKTSLWLTAWQRTLTGKATAQDYRVLILSHLIIGPLVQTIRNTLADRRDDDDEDWIWGDEKHWNVMDYLKACLAGPLGGMPLLRDLVSGFKADGVLDRYGAAPGDIKKIFEEIPESEKEEVEAVSRKVVRVLQATTAPAGVAASIWDQAFRYTDNVFISEEEKVIAQERAASKAEKEATEAVKEAEEGNPQPEKPELTLEERRAAARERLRKAEGKKAEAEKR